MKKYLAIVMALAVLGLMVFSALPVSADTPTPIITVTSSEPLLIGGVLTTTFPVTVAPNTVVSIQNTVYYTSQGERYSFKGWSDGTTGTSDTLTAAGSYSSVWQHEILVVINSVVASLQQSVWLPYGVPYDISAPAQRYRGRQYRIRFSEMGQRRDAFCRE